MPGLRHSPEVLSDGCEQELIASAIHSAQPQAGEVQNAFKVREEHLNFLSIFARLLVKTSLGDVASHIARRFIDAARDSYGTVCSDCSPGAVGGGPVS